jgi:hypothetical protein
VKITSGAFIKSNYGFTYFDSIGIESKERFPLSTRNFQLAIPSGKSYKSPSIGRATILPFIRLNKGFSFLRHPDKKYS